jgi:ferredoxin
MNAKEVKKKAISLGADIVGIGNISLFEGTPKENDPREIFPRAKSIIGVGFRILRGCFRGVESGTQFYQLPAMALANLDIKYIPHVLRRLSCFIEDNGFEGCVLTPELDRLPANAEHTNPEMQRVAKIAGRPVAKGKPAPDVLINPEQAAYICGLGEVGLGGFFLTPEFGPLQRFAFILTDAELEFDAPSSDAKLCDKCGLCVKACPGNAISAECETTKHWAGESINHREMDTHQCAAYFNGAHQPTNPFMPEKPEGVPEGVVERMRNGESLTKEESELAKDAALSYYGGVGGEYGSAMCGIACKRECMIHLQEKGVLKKRFVNPFRTEPAWYK